jgi:hypothetical protein
MDRRSLSLEWDMGAIRRFCALGMGLRSLTMVTRKLHPKLIFLRQYAMIKASNHNIDPLKWIFFIQVGYKHD